MFIGKDKAKLLLRKEAGFSIALADEHIKKLPIKKDGKRDKYRLADIRAIINEANKPSVRMPLPQDKKFRKFSAKMKENVLRQAAQETNKS